jgi:DNA-binding CsgD family transcriptional regulator
MSLSDRETQIVSCIAKGSTTKEIAAELGISISTVNWHVANVLTKLGAASRAEAVAAAYRAGLVPGSAARRQTRTTRVSDFALLGLSLGSVTVETTVVESR